MKRIVLLLAAILFVAGIHPVSAQQNEIAVLRAEIAKQQVDHRAAADTYRSAREAAAARRPPRVEDLQDDIKAQEDSVNSLREIVNSKVNLNGYYNFRFSADGSEEPMAFQQHHLGVLMAKQLGKFNFLMELELQNVPASPGNCAGARGRQKSMRKPRRAAKATSAAKGRWPLRTRGWNTITTAFSSVRVGKQLSPQYWWQNHYPNLTLSTALPIYLRELFPAELVGVTVQGSTATPVGTSEFGVGYKFYVANNNFEGNSRTDLRDGKSWGARGQVRFPTGGALRRFDVAADIYRGNVGLDEQRARRRQRRRLRNAARGFTVPLSVGVGARQVAGADADGLLPAAGVADRRRLDRVLSVGAAREPAHRAGRAAASGGR